MGNNSKEKSEIKSVIKFSFAAFIIVGLVGITPTGPKQISYNFFAMYTALCLVVIIVIARVINLFKPNWKSEYIALVLPFIVTGTMALNLIYATLSDWRWIAPLALMYPLAVALPFINQNLSKWLAKEIKTPKTVVGKIIVFGILAIAPMAGFVGVWLSKMSRRTSDGVIGATILGFILHIIFVWSEIDLAQQGWNLIQRNKKNNVNNT